MLKDSESLAIEILKHHDNLRMSVFERKEITSTIRHYSQLSVSFAEINKICQEIVSVLNKTDKQGDLAIESVSELKKAGQLLWDQLFTRTVKERLKNTPIRNLVLSLDEELINIPWELLYDGKEFLCLKFNLGRLIRTREQVAEVQYRNAESRLKMLILANPTDDLKSAYLEGLHIKNQFERQRKEMSIDFKSTYIDTLYVKKNLRDYDIVHFAGHCEYDSRDTQQSGWVLKDGRFTIKDIFALSQTLSLPGMVFSNACYSAAAAPDLMEADYQAKTYSLAAAFLFSGVRHYIGSIRKIEDASGQAFAREFYTQLLSGNPVGECLRQARLKLITDYGIKNIAWASYLLYGDTNFTMFQQKNRLQGLKIKQKKIFYKKVFKRAALSAFILGICAYLYFWLPSINPGTYFLFRKSNNYFLKGKNQEVISISKEIIKKDPFFLAAYPLLADTYRRLGDPETALKYYFDYAFIAQKRHDNKALASAYRGIGWTYHLFGEYPKAFDFYNKAISLSRANQDQLNEAASLEKLAVWYIDKEEYEKAFGLLTKSSEINRQKQYLSWHRYNLACDYFDIGLIFVNKDDYTSAREFYKKSQALFEKMKLNYELSDCYFNLGEICLYEKEYQRALAYYLRGLSLDQAHQNLPNIASGYNMIGELYIEMDNLAEAERYFNQALAVCKEIKAPLELASAYYNLGLLYRKKGTVYKAKKYLRLAQEIYSHVDTPDYAKIKQIFSELDNPS